MRAERDNRQRQGKKKIGENRVHRLSFFAFVFVFFSIFLRWPQGAQRTDRGNRGILIFKGTRAEGAEGKKNRGKKKTEGKKNRKTSRREKKRKTKKQEKNRVFSNERLRERISPLEAVISLSLLFFYVSLFISSGIKGTKKGGEMGSCWGAQ